MNYLRTTGIWSSPFLDAKHNTGKIGLLIKTSDISMQVEVQTLHVRGFMGNKSVNKVL